MTQDIDSKRARGAAALWGALVADAAALGAHWIYDVGRIADIARAQGGSAAFLPVDAAHYAGGVGYFAHGMRRSGMGTQYGEVTRLALAACLRDGGFDMAAYQADFTACFGPGGGWHGYIDRPTRGALANLAEGRSDPSGIDDDQLPALSALPAVVLAHLNDPGDAVARAVSVTSDNAIARAHGGLFAGMLTAVVGGAALPLALEQAVAEMPDQTIAAPLRAALAAPNSDSVAFGETTGRACHLPMAMPLALHILTHARDFTDAVERNIAAGGDSAGRAVVIGALMGAAGGGADIPLGWSLRMTGGAALWDQCRALAARV